MAVALQASNGTALNEFLVPQAPRGRIVAVQAVGNDLWIVGRPDKAPKVAGTGAWIGRVSTSGQLMSADRFDESFEVVDGVLRGQGGRLLVKQGGKPALWAVDLLGNLDFSTSLLPAAGKALRLHLATGRGLLVAGALDDGKGWVAKLDAWGHRDCKSSGG